MGISSYDRFYNSIYRGIVEDNNDPENLGRCKVRVPSAHGKLTYPIDVLPWARPIVLSPVNENRGLVNVPEIGDIVWVLFEGSVKDFPVYFGGCYARNDIPVDKDMVEFHLDEGSVISYDKLNKSYSVVLGETKLSIDDKGVHILGDVYIEGIAHVDNLVINNQDSVEGSTE